MTSRITAHRTAAACGIAIALGGGVGVSNPYFLVARSSGPTYDGVTFYNGPDGLRGAPIAKRLHPTVRPRPCATMTTSNPS
jgi:hypothetical protein